MSQRKRSIFFIALAAAVLAIGVVLAFLQPQQEDIPHAEAASSSLPTIRIGTDVLEPFFYVGRSGEYIGIDADIAKEACKRVGLKPKFVETSWTERDEALAAGTVDCIWSGFAIDGREDEYLWTDSYLDADIALLVKARCPSTSLGDFNGPGGVAVRANSISGSLLSAAGKADGNENLAIRAYGSSTMAMTAFVKNFTDGWASYKLVLDQLIQQKPKEYRYLESSVATAHLGVAFKKGVHTGTRDKLNRALAQMKRDGTIDRIVARYDKGADDDS